jgi:Chondroitinase B
MLSKANAGAVGDEFALTDGTYDNSSIQSITKSGVKCYAKNEGKAIIKGEPIDFKGDAVHFEGFDLQYSTTRQQVVYFFGNKCNFIKNKCHFVNRITSRQDWLNVRGGENKLQLNDIYGKQGLGNLILVGMGKLISKYNKILDNHLYNQKYTASAGAPTNGCEMMRIGSSEICNQDFFTEVAGNTMEDQATTDTELITVKSSSNDIHDNKIRAVKSSPTFRHGRLNKFRNNTLEGTGLRIYGRGHIVTGNKFLKNPLNALRQIVVGTGRYAEEEDNITSGDANYTQVRDLLFENNFVEMEDSTTNIIFNWGYGSEKLLPIGNKIIGNTISASKGTLAEAVNAEYWNNNEIRGNILWCIPGGTAKYGNMPTTGYIKKDPKLQPIEPTEPGGTTPPQSIEEILADHERRIKALESK